MNLNRYSIIALVLLMLGSTSAIAQQDGWPRTVALDEGMVTIYAPQLEAMDGGVLYYRAALAYRADADAEPIFGAGWLKSTVEIDEKNDIVEPAGMELTQTRFPDGTTDIEAELATALTRQSIRWNLDFTVAELEAALDAAEAESLAAQRLKSTPPKITYRDRPAILVSIDGDPVLREIEESPYQAVINTPFPLITDGKSYYLNAAKGAWYRATAVAGPYRFDKSPPEDIVEMVESAEQKSQTGSQSESDQKEPETPITAENAPEIVVSTVPAELIVTEGPADFVPLVEDLLVLKNSNSDVFLHVGDQKYYIVLSGRWYQSGSLAGPWENQPADELPAAFAQIPEDSAQADSRVYVAGTPEAEEAVLDAQVPQTAAVKRGEVEIDVAYDGEPDFEPVEGTEDLQYARNTGATVLESDRIYYLLEDGVWYVSNSPHGPWVVSDHRPGELETIEPSSPVYNTKYVYVYDSTPEVVYVGYTPGYVGSYVYGPTLVYGTGYYYRPWVSPYYYYPRVSTWGFSVGYSDYGGWSFGIGWNYGGWNLNYYSGGYWHYGQPWYNRYWGYWGPRGYCPTPYYGYNHYAYNPYGKRYGYRRGYRHGYNDGWDDAYDYGHDYGSDDGHGRQRNRNLYRDDGQQARIADTRDVWNNNPDFRNDPGPGQRGRNGQQYVDNRKIRQSKTGPVSRNDMRKKAQVRDVNTAASREPMVATNLGEVQRAEFNPSPRNRSQRDAGQRMKKRNKERQSRTTPVSRADLRQRGDIVASRSNRDKLSVNKPLPEPSRVTSRSTKRPYQQSVTEPTRKSANASPRQSRARKSNQQSRQQVTSPARKVSTRSAQSSSNRQVASAPREVQRKTSQVRPARQVTSQPREVQRRSSTQKPGRQITATQQRAAPQQSRQINRAPATQVNRTPSRPQAAARQSAQRSSAPAPRAQARNAPTRSAPRQAASASKPQPNRGNSRQRRNRN